jgi:hypothetical protein
MKGIYCSFSRSQRSYGRSALQLGKAPNRLYIYGRLGSQARKARATRRGEQMSEPPGFIGFISVSLDRVYF